MRSNREHGNRGGAWASDRIRIGVVLVLPLLVAMLLFVLVVSPAPAADGTPEQEAVAAATPVAYEPESSGEPAVSCDLESQQLLEAVAGTLLESTPVAIDMIEAVATDPCVAAPEPTPVVNGQDAILGSGDDAPSEGGSSGDGLDTFQEKSPETPPSEPLTTGFPEDEVQVELLLDPFVSGLPVVTIQEVNGSDPTMLGFPTGAVIGTPVGDPSFTGFPEPDAEAKEAGGATEPMGSESGTFLATEVIVDAVSVDGMITPGGMISYRFEVTNPGSAGVTILLESVTDLPEWTAIVSLPGSTGAQTDLLYLEAGARMEVLVLIMAPHQATIGDHVSTSLYATVQE